MPTRHGLPMHESQCLNLIRRLEGRRGISLRIPVEKFLEAIGNLIAREERRSEVRLYIYAYIYVYIRRVNDALHTYNHTRKTVSSQIITLQASRA